jgi:hypothetical protein
MEKAPTWWIGPSSALRMKKKGKRDFVRVVAFSGYFSYTGL